MKRIHDDGPALRLAEDRAWERVSAHPKAGDAGSLITLPEAAELLRLQVATLRAWRLRRKNLNFIQVGERAVRVRLSDVEKLIAGGTQPPRARFE
jgi:excisionase family DNA binding protein